jgi:hypothetical protein
MLDRIPVDAKALVGVMLRYCEPKTQRKDRENPNSEQVPALDKNGVPKWTVILSIETLSPFGKRQHDDIEVTVTSPKNPCEGIAERSDVSVVGLTLGMMPIGKGKAVTVFYTADAILPLRTAQAAQPVQQQRMATAQPPQPARAAASGE